MTWMEFALDALMIALLVAALWLAVVAMGVILGELCALRRERLDEDRKGR